MSVEQKNLLQQGQTLVETVVGVSMLVMAITAALGLVNYSLSLSTNITKQMIGLGLAREGQEAVRNMRDTNWLLGSLSQNCGALSDQACYSAWQDASDNGGYIIDPAEYILSFNMYAETGNSYWNLSEAQNNAPELRLCLDTEIDGGFYNPADTNGVCDTGSNFSGYRRLVQITSENGGGDYDLAIGARLKVSVMVWWTDRGCGDSETFPGSGRCGVELVTYLTNWKNY